MKRIGFGLLAAAAVSFGLGQAATAADMGRAPVYKAPPAPIFMQSWSGCYIGGNAGGAWADKDFTAVSVDGVPQNPSIPGGSHTANGFAGGGQIGCDYQAGAWVFGVRGMWDWADLTGDNVVPGLPDFTVNSRINSFGTLTGRVGFAMQPSLLLYVLGGVAWVNDDHWATSTGLGTIATASATRTGWDVGVGLEYMFAPNWSLWVEYDHMDFGTDTLTFTGVDAFAGLTVGADVDQTVDKVLVGINYRFNFGGPVVARY